MDKKMKIADEISRELIKTYVQILNYRQTDLDEFSKRDKLEIVLLVISCFVVTELKTIENCFANKDKEIMRIIWDEMTKEIAKQLFIKD